MKAVTSLGDIYIEASSFQEKDIHSALGKVKEIT